MKKLHFRIVTDCDLSIFEQIRSQIISSLYTGKIREGDLLPSVRELAAEIGVNHKTIYKIYRQLAAENFARPVEGKGYFVRERMAEDFPRLRREALLTLMSTTLEKASLLGLGKEKFAQLLQRFVTGKGIEPFSCIIVDDEEEITAFVAELRGKMAVSVFPVLLDQMEAVLTPSDPQIKQYEWILTTSWHLDQVRPYALRLGKKILEIKTNPDIYNEVVQLIQAKNVGVVVHDIRTLHATFDVFMNIFYPSTNRTFIITPVSNRGLLDRIAREAEIVFCSPLCWDEVRQAMPASLEIRTFSNFISTEFINHLKMLQLFG